MRQPILFYKLLCVAFLCIIFLETQAQVNITSSATVSISSSFQVGNYTASDLVDGDKDLSDWDTGWYADFFNSSNPQSADFDFGSGGAIVDQYDLYGHTDATVRPDSHLFQARNSTSDAWTTLNTVSTKIGSGLSTHSFSNSTYYRYYRILMTDNGGSSGTGGFQEVELYSSAFVPLPVSLIYFNVQIINNQAQLTWATSSEVNNKHFVVEKSIHPLAGYTTVGYVSGNGTSNQVNFYSFTDNTTTNGEWYYRIRQVDYDGTEEAFNPKSISINLKTNYDVSQEISASPVPFKNELRITYEGDDTIYDLTLMDIFGKEIYYQEVNDTEVQLDDLGRLLDGIYILSLKTDSGMKTLRVVKEGD